MTSVRDKTGRRAPENVREQAREIVAIYHLAATCPDGKFCLNPGNEPELRAYIDSNDVLPLLAALETLADHGVLELPDDFEQVQQMEILLMFENRVASGTSLTRAYELLAERWSVDPKTISRKIQRARKTRESRARKDNP